ncbi:MULTISPECIES: flavin-containing monooxygenase [unclassified Nocardioides]|uniref:flavin-containing monooxygenase n=1 Tax=unclassified Nocardioides TaxID=2615069 RepID=UPI0006FBF4AA|nr:MULTISPECIES: NAD(P)/FAD-dependent oxidoreductase [unclassified Nocardioides]KQY57598.1 FAD-containing monooxygenase EthA [Nocardioides sp. Root140]KRF15106.1 FAD-containing monooxygenase EthA [Nocardioides sp. Soil796]
MSEHVDVLIIGAGLSGIGAAATLATRQPDKTYLVLERRPSSGGTWDLFRYPGVRSDSDMYTLGYRFKPWLGDKALADGASILDYVRETAREYGVDERIRYDQHVTSADWDSESATWRVAVDEGDESKTYTASFLWSCTGYYNYDEGYTPEFTGRERFRGEIVHPQHWPADLTYAGKKVVVIGSGATAVTLVPAMADDAAKITMLQRSPTYILSLPARDPLALGLRKVLPRQAAYNVTRIKNIAQASALYNVSQKQPRLVRRLIRRLNQKQLPEGYPVDVHFKPTYGPWDQRLCLVPNGDLFRAIRHGKAEVVTDTIDTFTETGLRLGSGAELEADIIITATGLNLRLFGGVEVTVDGEKLDAPSTMAYRGLMLSDLPNFAYTVGYTNASWTLKADLVAEFVCRLLQHMTEVGARTVVPVRQAGVGEEPFMDFEAGYVLRSLDELPKQGDVEPWKLKQSWFHDVRTIRRTDLDDGVLQFR